MSHYTKQNKRKKEINIAQNLNYTIKGENILLDPRACSKPWGTEEIQCKCRKNTFQLLKKPFPFQLATNVPFLTGTVLFNYTFFLFSSSILKNFVGLITYLEDLSSFTVCKLLPFSRFYNQYISIWWHANISLQVKYILVCFFYLAFN